MLEYAWAELVEQKRRVTTEELAEVQFISKIPLFAKSCYRI